MSNHTAFTGQQHQMILLNERIKAAGSIAAFFIAGSGGNAIAQQVAKDYAERIASTGASAADSIYRGFKAGKKVMRQNNVIPFRRVHK